MVIAPNLLRTTDLQWEVGLDTAKLHALLDVNGDPAVIHAALLEARRELDLLIRRVEREVPGARRKARRGEK